MTFLNGIIDCRIAQIFKALVAAATTTVLLGFFIERLVAMEDVTIEEPQVIDLPDIHYKPVPPKPPKIQRVKKVPDVEPDPIIPTSEPHVVSASPSFTFPKTQINSNAGIKPSLGSGANFPIARFLQTPTYPHRAAQRGLEGYVDVIFDVTAAGTTENIRVIGAEPQGVFEYEAVKAVKRWRYQPRMEGNTPVPFRGMKQRVRFQMKQA